MIETSCQSCRGRMLISSPGTVICPDCKSEVAISDEVFRVLSAKAKSGSDSKPHEDTNVSETKWIADEDYVDAGASQVAAALSFIGTLGVVSGVLSILVAWAGDGGTSTAIAGASGMVSGLVITGLGSVINLLARIEFHLRTQDYRP